MSEISDEDILKNKAYPKTLPSDTSLPKVSKSHELLEIDPNRCKPWKYHNRDLAWLTKERCQDLIRSIQQSGQIEPVLVREVKDDPNYEYEIICGVRRWFACSQIPNQKLLACLTTADDKTCMILMHSENANSKDISEFERAFSFSQQMKSGLFKSQVEMAEALGLTQGYVSKMINAAEIFEYPWIRSLFQNKLDIPVKYAYALSGLLKKSYNVNLIKPEAEMIQNELQESPDSFSPPKILKRLINCIQPATSMLSESVILTANDKPVLFWHEDKFGKISIVIEKEAAFLDRSLVEKAYFEAVREHIFNKLFPGE